MVKDLGVALMTTKQSFEVPEHKEERKASESEKEKLRLIKSLGQVNSSYSTLVASHEETFIVQNTNCFGPKHWAVSIDFHHHCWYCHRDYLVTVAVSPTTLPSPAFSEVKVNENLWRYISSKSNFNFESLDDSVPLLFSQASNWAP